MFASNCTNSEANGSPYMHGSILQPRHMQNCMYDDDGQASYINGGGGRGSGDDGYGMGWERNGGEDAKVAMGEEGVGDK